jgi:hypothetical protein
MGVHRMFKWLLVVAVVAFAGGVASVHPGVFVGIWEEIYPSDTVKRQALELCFMQDHNFNRLDAAQRESCYRHARLPLQAALASNAAADMLVAARVTPNAVDLRRAAAEGTLPRDDIRRLEQTENARHSLH